jgi:hypothetical protein
MANIDVEMLKESLYKVSKALFCIGEVCVDVSKQHISESDAFNKIRGYLNDAHMWSRFQVDQLIANCIEPVVTNAFEENQNDWLNKALSELRVDRDRFVYYATNIDDLEKYCADANKIAAAKENTKKYLKE